MLPGLRVLARSAVPSIPAIGQTRSELLVRGMDARMTGSANPEVLPSPMKTKKPTHITVRRSKWETYQPTPYYFSWQLIFSYS